MTRRAWAYRSAMTRFMDAVFSAQEQVIRETPFVFAGPATDDLIGDEWRYDAVHFNERGLREHARRWVEAISLPPCQGFENVPIQTPCEEQSAFPDAASVEVENEERTDYGTADSVVGQSDSASPRDALAQEDFVREEGDTRTPRERGGETPEVNDRGVDALSQTPPAAGAPAAGSREEQETTGQSGCNSAPAGSGPFFPTFLMVLISLIARRAQRRSM